MSELEATRLRSGLQVRLTVDALQGDRSNLFNARQASAITGTVEKVVPVVDASTRDFLVRVLVPRNPRLFPGMFARGAIVTAHHHGVIAIPKEVIVERGSEQEVYVAEGNLARRHTIVAGAATHDLVQVISGLAPGDRVITAGQQTLQDGDAISIQREPGQ